MRREKLEAARRRRAEREAENAKAAERRGTRLADSDALSPVPTPRDGDDDGSGLTGGVLYKKYTALKEDHKLLTERFDAMKERMSDKVYDLLFTRAGRWGGL